MYALLLNASYEPLHFVNQRRVLRLLVRNKVKVYEGETGPSTWDKWIASTTGKIQLPATIVLRQRVHKKWKPPRFHRKALYNRDNWQCQYCGEGLERRTVTIDHVLPRAQGGKTTWLNCVTSCTGCNKDKGDRTPAQAGMELRKQPAVPTQLDFWDVSSKHAWHHDWDPFFERHR